jgi:hypothetical protein
MRKTQLARRSIGMENRTRVPTTQEIVMIRVEARIGMLTSCHAPEADESRIRSVTAGSLVEQPLLTPPCDQKKPWPLLPSVFASQYEGAFCHNQPRRLNRC